MDLLTAKSELLNPPKTYLKGILTFVLMLVGVGVLFALVI
jgi:hypothetical protein